MKDLIPPPALPLRPPAQVMRLERMGVAFPTRLSFLPTLLRRLHGEGARVTRPIWNVDNQGYGHAVYSIPLGGHIYSLVAVTTPLSNECRTDRVIAEAWDSAYVLYDGIPDAAEIARICGSAPRQEAARYTERDLVLSRANKSVRLFSHVVEALRAGQQPDTTRIRNTGYLMRTTAVYANGKFGTADRTRITDRPGLAGPFMAEMLTIWLIRGFTHDLVEHLSGAPLERHLKRHLGIGNATGLGMAPFLVSHPLLLDAWMQARETALARVRAIPNVTPAQASRLRQLARRVARHLSDWRVPSAEAQASITALRAEWSIFTDHLSDMTLERTKPINALWKAAQSGSIQLQELVAAFLIEPFGPFVDDLTDRMATPFTPQIDPTMRLADLRTALSRDWKWALAIDFDQADEQARFWYVSEAKLEPRLGLRFEEPGADRESPLDIARQVQAMATALGTHEGDLMAFLRIHPEHRAALRRVQTLIHHPYAEIRDNLIGAACRPIDMLRCKLAFFGATRFDPKSDLWTRITLAQGAPLFDELDRVPDWWLPAFATS